MTLADGYVLRICRGHSCCKHADALRGRAERCISERGLEGAIGVLEEYCFGRCHLAPNILVERWRDGRRNERALIALMMGERHPDMYYLHGARPDDVERVIERHRKELGVP